MTVEPAQPPAEFLATIQPIVLVGGRSLRFGRDKLRESWGEHGQVLVQRPVEALRGVFGRRVKLVGECHPSILSLADGVITDRFPGVGPIGGIVSALMGWGGPVFVLAGDMPSVTPTDVTRILNVAAGDAEAWAVLATTDRSHPCAGLYAQAAGAALQLRIEQQQYQLSTAIPEQHIRLVRWSTDAAVNVNIPVDLGAHG